MTNVGAMPPTFRSLTFGGALRAAAAREPGKIAIKYGDKELSFAALAERAGRLCDATIAWGIKKGDVAAIISRNRTEFIEVVAGVPDAGAIVATINPRLAPPEIRQALEDCGAKLIFADEASEDLIAETGLDGLTVIAFGPVYERLLADASTSAIRPQIDEWDGWTLPYTSGTTGQPKGVMLSHRSRMLLGLICAAEFGCFGPDDRFLCISPFNHGGGMGFPASALAAGGSIEILDKFEPETVLERLKFGGITGTFMVPTHFQMIFALPAETLEPYRLPPVRSILANAAPLPQAMKEKIIPYFGDGVLHELYAATETGLVCNLRPKDQLRKQQCVGTPFPHVEAEVRRADGGVCDTDEVGELWARNPVLFSGYWNRPDETAKAVKDGWVSVGDMARRDAEGFIYIVDRLKDMVISGGVNIYPREVEEILFTHPGIADVAVIGVPDKMWGEHLKAFIVPREAGFALDTLAAFCAGRIAPYKVPREWALLSELPRNANGKVLKIALRKVI